MLHPVQSAGPWPMSETHPGGDRSPGQVQGKVNAAELTRKSPDLQRTSLHWVQAAFSSLGVQDSVWDDFPCHWGQQATGRRGW